MVSEAPLLSKKGYEYKATKMLTVSYENGLTDRQRIVRIREGIGVHLALQLGRCKSPFQYWGVCHVRLSTGVCKQSIPTLSRIRSMYCSENKRVRG